MFCRNCGVQLGDAPPGRFCQACGARISNDAPAAATVQARSTTGADPAAQATFVRRVSEYEKISGILWMVLGGIQVLTVIGVIAGLWNLFAGYSRLKVAPRILSRDPEIPEIFEPVTQLVVIGVLNVLLGGVVGVLFVAFDFFIRDQVLQNRHIFRGTSAPLAAAEPATAPLVSSQQS